MKRAASPPATTTAVRSDRPMTPQETRRIASSMRARRLLAVRMQDAIARALCHAQTRSDHDDAVPLTKLIDSGSYGQVFESQIPIEDHDVVSVARKRIRQNPRKDNGSDWHRNACSEIQTANRLSDLVHRGEFPHFVYCYGSCTSDPDFADLYMERATGNLLHLFMPGGRFVVPTSARPASTAAAALGWLVQVFMALAWMARRFAMVHNDLYFRNILYADVDATMLPRLTYVLERDSAALPDVRISTPTSSRLILICDWGLCSTETALAATDPVPKTTPLGAETMQRLCNFAVHVAGDDMSLAPYLRDIVAVLSSAHAAPLMPPSIRDWAGKECRAVLQSAIDQPRRWWCAESLIDWVCTTFTADRLRSQGLVDAEVLGAITLDSTPMAAPLAGSAPTTAPVTVPSHCCFRLRRV